MTRVRFDPSFVEDERWERLGIEALVLHVTAVSYTVRTLSDGLLSPARVRSLTPLVSDADAVASLLVEEGLWEKQDDGRVRVCQAHDDLRRADGRGDEQPSRAFVERERDRARDRKEAWKKKNDVRNGVPTAVRNTPQSSAEQSSAVQDPKGPSPALHGSPDAVPGSGPLFGVPCQHGTPDGELLTKAGTPRCPACRGVAVQS